jgi:hypothetical protein
MPAYKGYKIEAVVEQSLDSALQEVKAKTFKVSIDDKVIAVGLPTMEAAKNAVDRRHKGRTRAGRDPIG